MSPARRAWWTHVICPMIVALAFCIGSASAARADCTIVAPVNASFGSVTSFVVQSTVQQTSTTNAGLTCAPSTLNLLQTGDHFFATLSSANGGLKGPGVSGTDLVPYTVYGDATTAHPMAFGVQFDYAVNDLIRLLGLLGTQSATMPMHFRTSSGANVAAGTYTDTISIFWAWNYCPGIGAFGVCLGARHIGQGNSAVQLTMTVTPACEVSSTPPDVSFGQAPVPASFSTVTQSLTVRCTKNLAVFTVGLGSGEHPSGGRRQMANGGNVLQYDFFKPGTNEVWGASGAARMTNPAPPNGATPQPFPYQVTIYADQDTPPVGVYSDTVVVDVAF